jgi:hypothetical protein
MSTEANAPLADGDDPSFEYQDALLAALADAVDAADALARLRSDPRTRAFREAVDAMEPRMIEVAIALVRRWSIRS